MTHTELIKEVFRERGMSESLIEKKVAAGNLMLPTSIANEEIVLQPGVTIEQCKAGIHQMFDKLDRIPKSDIRAVVSGVLKNRRDIN